LNPKIRVNNKLGESYLIDRLKPKSQMSRNILTLMTGTTVAQAIPIAISPILTRIYTPEDFGVYALFMALVMIFGSVVSARYELAIMLPRRDKDAINLVALSLLISIFISTILILIVLIFNDDLVTLLNNKNIGFWLYFIPLGVFFIGLFNILVSFSNRKKEYKDITQATVIKSIILAMIQLSMGFLKAGASGLISGYIFSQFFANTKLLKNIINDKILLSAINRKKIYLLAKRYKKFPQYSTLATLLNATSHNINNIMIPILFSYHTMGFYALAQRVMGLPATVIGTAVGKVFFQASADEKHTKGNSREIFIATLQKLTLLGLVMFSVLFVIIIDVVDFVFGEDWTQVGEIIQILIPFFFIKFISSALSTTLIVYEKQKTELFINIILLLSTIAILFFNQDSFITFIKNYSLFMSLNYSILLSYFYHLSKGKS